MAKLDPTNTGDRVVFGYLHGLGYTDENYVNAGDEIVADLGYWNPADPNASNIAARNVAIGIINYALQNATVFGTQWQIGYTTPAQQHSATGDLITIAQTSTNTVSDIAGQTNKMFQFS
jgi:hypothetical protein